MVYIPYNSSNKEWAAENRSPMTKAERKMRFGLLKDRPRWYKFIRQKMIDSFILDFYCSKLLLWIEVDGPSHNTRKVYDKKRTEKIWEYWIKIIRYQNEDVFFRLDWVSQDLEKELEVRAKQLEETNLYPAGWDPSPCPALLDSLRSQETPITISYIYKRPPW